MMPLKIAMYILAKIFSPVKSSILFVLQNNNELRATGGFITRVLELQCGKFRIKKKFIDVIEDLKSKNAEEAPMAMNRMLKIESVQFRDANYEPDFGKTSKELIKLFNDSYPASKISTLIAVNYSFIEKLLNILGPVGEFTGENLFYRLTTSVSEIDLHDSDERINRKEVIQNLFKDLIRTLIVKFWKWGKIYGLANASLRNKDIQVYAEGKIFHEQFGAAEGQDFLAVIDNNYLGLKSNRYLKRNVTHSLVLGENAEAKVIIELFHCGPRNYPLSGLYQSFMQVYIPKDAYDINLSEEDFTVENVEDCKVLGFRNAIAPGGSKHVEIKYRMPEIIFRNGKYSFKYIKQSGVENEIVSGSVLLPISLKIKTDNKKIKIRENCAFWEQVGLKEDFQYAISTEKNNISPRIFFHEIVNPGLIEIRFNEPVFIKTKEGAVKLDCAKTGEKIKIEKAALVSEGRVLHIYTKNLPTDEGRFYRLCLENIFNAEGRELSACQKKLTVVYRARFFQNRHCQNPK